MTPDLPQTIIFWFVVLWIAVVAFMVHPLAMSVVLLAALVWWLSKLLRRVDQR